MTRYDRDDKQITAIEHAALPLGGALSDYDPIIRAAEGKRFVLIGEATHGTAEFYRARAEITRRLIAECGFDAVTAEADWPDAYRVNRYVSLSSNEPADAALSDFGRFPTWMWRNTEVLSFIEWLRAYNSEFRSGDAPDTWPAGFYGLDLYGLRASVGAVISYLRKIDPPAATRAQARYSCLDHFMDNPQSYGQATATGLIDSCEKEVVRTLVELRRHAYEYIQRNGFVAQDEYFEARQNARLVKSAEEYYRALYRGRPNSWNLRDRHMFETLEDIADHLGKRLNREPRIVVWAHNSHIGNAAATDMARQGEYNIGQLTRTAYPGQTLLIGFSTCRGTVTAADNWDQPGRSHTINEPFPRSYEELFHHVSHKNFMLDLREDNDAVANLMSPRLQRAIGVVYRPGTERYSHYLNCRLPEQFDFILHYDETSALHPLPTRQRAGFGELEETYPTGL